MIEDYRTAISKSKQYMGAAIKRHVEEAIKNVLTSLAYMIVGAVALMGLLSAIGGAFGGPGGTAAGFKLSLFLLEWVGLGFLVAWIAGAMKATATAFYRFIRSVWNARGDDKKKLDGAGWDFADAIGTWLGTLVEALLLWAASVGIGAAIGRLRTTRFGRSLGESFFMDGEGRTGQAARGAPPPRAGR